MQTQGYEFASDMYGEVYATRVPQPWRVVHIDRLIDGVHREMQRRGHGFLFNPYSATSWDRAWKKHPELHARKHALMEMRGREADYRDRMTVKAVAREQRRRSAEAKRESRRQYEAMKCPTCGAHTLSNAA